MEVSFADTGPGVDADMVSRLFDAFVTSKPDGLGVGLSISRNIVEAHGGRLWFDPSPARGSTFRFTLSVIPDEAPFEAA